MPRFVGIDYGRKRIGLAISDPEACIASPLATRPTGRDADESARLISEWLTRHYDFDAFVIGLPLNMDGSEGPQAKETRQFAAVLSRVACKPVHAWDERLTSWAAEQAMVNSGLTRRKKRARVDRVAAQMILQSYLDHRSDSAGR